MGGLGRPERMAFDGGRAAACRLAAPHLGRAFWTERGLSAWVVSVDKRGPAVADGGSPGTGLRCHGRSFGNTSSFLPGLLLQ